MHDDGAQIGVACVGERAGEVARLEPVDYALDANVANRAGGHGIRRAFRRLVGAPGAEGREGK